MSIAFDSPDLLAWLESASDQQLDDLEFGVIAMDRKGEVVAFNGFEAARSGIGRAKVLGRNFFEVVGPCTNNYLVAQRYHDEPDLDAYQNFVFTLRMKPTPVRLRMVAAAGSERQYLVVINR